jgi:hypothetical protein
MIQLFYTWVCIRSEVSIQKQYLCAHVFCGAFHNSQDMESAYVSINRWIGEENVILFIHTYSVILLSQKNKILSIAVKSMELEDTVKLNKQDAKKQILYVLFHIRKLQKKVIDLKVNTELLKWQRSIWEGDQKLEKRSVRDE